MNRIKLSKETEETINAYVTLILLDPRMDFVSRTALIITLQERMKGCSL